MSEYTLKTPTFQISKRTSFYISTFGDLPKAAYSGLGGLQTAVVK
jgi:hypothetical protein